MESYTEDTLKRLTQMLRETETAYNSYKKLNAYSGSKLQDSAEWSAAHLLESGKLANLFLNPSGESLREETTEAG
jgi:hypothetical protein